VSRLGLLFGLTFVFALCIAAYYPGLHGDFVFDDWSNIIQNARLHVDTPTFEGLRQAALSADSGKLKRPVSMLSFWLNYYTTGLDPFYFKLTNLFIHLLNGLGLFWLTRLLLHNFRRWRPTDLKAVNCDWLALVVASTWLVHPLNVTSVLYVVQRMTSLSATFVVFGLICYVLGRQRLERGAQGWPLIFLGLFGFGSLAVLSKENGVLLPLYIAVIEVTLFRFSSVASATSTKLKAFSLVTVVLPTLAALAFVLTHPDWLANQYEGRDFSPAERLMTQARALWLYLLWTIAPMVGELGLFHDDVAVSRGLLRPATTLLAVAGLLVVLGAAMRFRKVAPLFAFATLWYLVGHVLESSIIGLELVHEHRNYLPLYGPLLAGLYLIVRTAGQLSPRTRLAIPVAFVIGFSAVTTIRSFDWRDLYTLRMALVHHHPSSARSNYQAGVALADLSQKDPAVAATHYEQTKRYFDRSTSLDRTAVNGLFGLILLNAINGRPLDARSVDQLVERLSDVPVRFTVVAPFRSLVDWTTKGTVFLPRDTVLRLFGAALGNETSSQRTRATLLSVLSSYHYNVAADVQEAVSLALAAVEEDPTEPVHHLSLADLALKLGNVDLAARELEAVTRNDPLGRFTLQTRELAHSIAKAGTEG
jgi:hypothetical protein